MSGCGDDSVTAVSTSSSTTEFDDDDGGLESVGFVPTDVDTGGFDTGFLDTGFLTDDTFPTETFPDDTGPVPQCGDGFVDFGEECDPGEAFIGSGQDCLEGCILNVCGDGDWGPSEECDDGNDNDEDGCTSECRLTFCGDGNLGDFEECDDANDDDTDACTSRCRFNVCGDGFLHEGVETCDNGPFNGPDRDCTPQCEPNVCGDGFQHGVDEECDPGQKLIGPGLECLDGCVLNVCGDGDQWAGELCDDGNMDNTDACAACMPAECGDGFVWDGMEECDDANGNDLDRCRDNCVFHRATQLALGGNHTCVLLDSGNVKCWGNGSHGRTGHVSIENVGDDEPASAQDFVQTTDPVIQIVTGIGHTCVRHDGGTARCFGRNAEGQLGNASVLPVGDDETPGSADPVALGGVIEALNSRSGAFHTCAALDVGVRCWGRSTDFVLGDPAVTENIGDTELASAAPLVDVGGTVTGLALGNRHSCALIEGGAIRCWGVGANGRLGYGSLDDVGDNETPADAGDVSLGGVAEAITAGWNHTCALIEGGTVRCWGQGNNGRLGYSATGDLGGAPQFVPSLNGDVNVGGVVLQIEAGLAHTCARLEGDTVRCWGAGNRGQLGYGNPDSVGDNETPADAGDVPVGAPVVSIAADGTHTCAITDTGTVRCWGQGDQGRLGYGSEADIGVLDTPADAGDVPLFP